MDPSNATPKPKGTVGEQGVKAVEKKKYSEAIVLLDKALENSKSPSWLLARAKAHQHLRNHDQALRDVEMAYHSAIKRGADNTRNLIIDAQYRRAVILFAMGRYADADCCARWSQKLAALRPAAEDDGISNDIDDDGFYTVTLADVKAQVKTDYPADPRRDFAAGYPGEHKEQPKRDQEIELPKLKAWHQAWLWRCQTLERMEKLPIGDPGRKVTVTMLPPEPEWEKTGEGLAKGAGLTDPETIPLKKPVQKSVLLRTDFYQTSDHITVSLFAKGVDPKKLEVDFTEEQIVIGPLPRDDVGYAGLPSYSMLILENYIVPEGCRYSVTPSKVELVLQKKVPGVKWAKWGEEHLKPPYTSAGDSSQTPHSSAGSGSAKESSTPSEAEDEQTTVAAPGAAGEAAPAQPKEQLSVRPASTTATGGAPAYPTSSKTGPKNWDLLGDSDGEEEEKHDVDHFFKKLYSSATDEQRRAMMKSFVESNGTTLSTDWSDVGSRKVTTAPPDGVEEKKW